jgi:hypothetical protein
MMERLVRINPQQVPVFPVPVRRKISALSSCKLKNLRTVVPEILPRTVFDATARSRDIYRVKRLVDSLNSAVCGPCVHNAYGIYDPFAGFETSSDDMRLIFHDHNQTDGI